MRGDLADVRLAEYVFAPHYAAPMACVTTRAVTLFADRARSSGIAEMADSETFDTLELAGDHAWGIAPERGLVGYIERSALDHTCETPSR